MSTLTSTQTPIKIHIPPTLKQHTIPLSQFLALNPNYSHLAVGACIFFPPPTSSSHRKKPHLLLVQRAATERSFPNLWEIPGGSSDPQDPTILHSVAREVFEETGLRMKRVVREIGKRGIEFTTPGRDGRNEEKWLKLSFEIEVVEIGDGNGGVHADTRKGYEAEEVTGDATEFDMDSLSIFLDPTEHQRHAWVTEEEIRSESYDLVSEDQRKMLLLAFTCHNNGDP